MAACCAAMQRGHLARGHEVERLGERLLVEQACRIREALHVVRPGGRGHVTRLHARPAVETPALRCGHLCSCRPPVPGPRPSQSRASPAALLIADAATRIHVELVKVHHVGTGCLRAELIFLAWCAAKIGRLLTRAPKRSREAEILSVLPLRASASLSAFYGVGGRVFQKGSDDTQGAFFIHNTHNTQTVTRVFHIHPSEQSQGQLLHMHNARPKTMRSNAS